MAQLMALADRIRIEVPGCPDLLIEQHLLRTARMFCRDTHVWTVPLDPIYPYEVGRGQDQPFYDLDLPTDSALLSVFLAEQDERPIGFNVRLNPYPGIQFDRPKPLNPITVHAVLQPAHDATTIPDQLLFDYQEALIGGTLARLMLMPKRDWTMPEVAPVHQSAYDTGVGEARVRRSRGNRDGGQRVALPGFI